MLIFGTTIGFLNLGDYGNVLMPISIPFCSQGSMNNLFLIDNPIANHSNFY